MLNYLGTLLPYCLILKITLRFTLFYPPEASQPLTVIINVIRIR